MQKIRNAEGYGANVHYVRELASSVSALETQVETNSEESVTFRCSWKTSDTTTLRQLCTTNGVPEVVVFTHESSPDPRVFVDLGTGEITFVQGMTDVDLNISFQVQREEGGGTTEWGFYLQYWSGTEWVTVGDTLRYLTFKSNERDDTEHVAFPLALSDVEAGTKIRYMHVCNDVTKNVGPISNKPFNNAPVSAGVIVSISTR